MSTVKENPYVKVVNEDYSLDKKGEILRDALMQYINSSMEIVASNEDGNQVSFEIAHGIVANLNETLSWKTWDKKFEGVKNHFVRKKIFVEKFVGRGWSEFKMDKIDRKFKKHLKKYLSAKCDKVGIDTSIKATDNQIKYLTRDTLCELSHVFKQFNKRKHLMADDKDVLFRKMFHNYLYSSK